MHALWPRRVVWAPTDRPTGPPTPSITFGLRWRSERSWCNPAASTSIWPGRCCVSRACATRAAAPRPSRLGWRVCLCNADERLERLVASDSRVRRLCTVPGVGPVTAATFVATVDGVERFAGAHQVEAYLGLVPRELSSGERQYRGRITKAGNGRARWLLVEAAWSILRYKKPETLALRRWAERIADRRGKRRAAVAMARRLAGILFAMLRDDTSYQPEKVAAGVERRPAA